MEKKTKKIVGLTIAIVMIITMSFSPLSAMGVQNDSSNSETIGTGNPSDTTQKDLEARAREEAIRTQKINDAKTKYLKKIKKTFKSLKNYMSSNQKKFYKKKVQQIEKAQTVKTVKVKYKKIVKIFKKAKAYKKEHSYQGTVGVSCYGPYEGECTTATGRTITNGTYYVAVPIGRVVSHSSWNKMSKSNKRKYFYYHETVYLKHNGRTCKASVEDCGGFANMKSYGYYRLFDLTPAVFHSLGISGVGTVSWHY